MEIEIPEQTIAKWDFPELSPGGTGRILTKHFTNLALTLDYNELALLSFLVYQSELDNSIKPTIKLFRQYGAAAGYAREKYGQKKLKTSLPTIKKIFQKMIERGFLLPHNQKFIINPNLTYSKQYVKGTFYIEWIKNPNPGKWVEHVNSNL